MRAALLSLSLLVLTSLSAAQSEEASVTAPVALVPHRAIYDLSLGTTRGNSQLAGVRGRILYDFGGSACQGYSLEFRQVSELDSGEGKVSTSDLRSTTWEGADAKSFKFTSQNFVDENLIDSVDGRAEREPTKTAVALEKPQQKSLSLAPSVVFPTEHMVRVIKAARAAQAILSFPVYDGSETGDKVFDTLTVIGHEIKPDERDHDDAATAEPKLASVPRWPVTVSYFERDKAKNDTEQTPAYAISFELYANGISRALALDYNNFVINGKLSSLDIKDAAPCR
ncbi:MAG: cell envelope integrity EipB family protein [Rhizobiales bacterium]|nr:cell envelope integrity EipB family protein [Hyphomicrobiales bacterium]